MRKLKHSILSVVIVCCVLLTSCYSNRLTNSNRSVEDIANQVWTYSQTHPDGFTLNLATMTEPNKGIAVSYKDTQGCHSREKLNYVIEHALSHSGFVGGWLDVTDSLYYFDSSRVFPEDSLEAAKKFGIENGQIAIFIISEGKEIRLQ